MTKNNVLDSDDGSENGKGTDEEDESESGEQDKL